MKKLILASGSPRRKQMLEDLDIIFDIEVPNIHECIKDHEKVEDYVLRNAQEKALVVSCKNKEAFVLACDTIVISPCGELLEKPQNKEDAYRMMQMLSNEQHRVMSAYSIAFNGSILRKKAVTTFVWFKELLPEEISWYVNTSEPYDKAGGYAIQGKASSFISKIEGSCTNVVGMPLTEVMGDLKEIGWCRYF